METRKTTSHIDNKICGCCIYQSTSKTFSLKLVYIKNKGFFLGDLLWSLSSLWLRFKYPAWGKSAFGASLQADNKTSIKTFKQRLQNRPCLPNHPNIFRRTEMAADVEQLQLMGKKSLMFFCDAVQR